MAWTTPKTYTSVEVLNAAADLNVYETANMTYLREPPACAAKRIAITSVGVGVTLALLLTSEDYDPDAMHSLVTNTTRVTLPETAVYLVTAHVWWEATTASALYQVIIRLNGTTLLAQEGGQKTGEITQHVSALREFTSGDYLEVCAAHGSGSAENILRGGLSVVRLRDG